MKALTFESNKEELLDAIEEYFEQMTEELPQWFNKAKKNNLSSNSFDVEAVCYDSGALIDYRIFDPFHYDYDGYTNPDGWSNWECDGFVYIDDSDFDELFASEGKQVYENDNVTIKLIDFYGSDLYRVYYKEPIGTHISDDFWHECDFEDYDHIDGYDEVK